MTETERNRRTAPSNQYHAEPFQRPPDSDVTAMPSLDSLPSTANFYPAAEFDAQGNFTRYGLASLNSGDTAWMLTSTALVLLMTMPGLAIYYSGMVRDKNVLACEWFTKTYRIKNPTFPHNLV